MTGFQRVMAKATQPWWGKHRPSSYVARNEQGVPAGIGILADKDYAAFNMWFYCMGTLPSNATFEQHRTLLHSYLVAREFGKVEVNGFPLAEWAMTLSEKEFASLVAKQKPITITYSNTVYTLSCGMFASVLAK